MHAQANTRIFTTALIHVYSIHSIRTHNVRSLARTRLIKLFRSFKAFVYISGPVLRYDKFLAQMLLLNM